MTDEFLKIFNNYYPFERYLFFTPLKYTKTMYVTEIHVKEKPEATFDREGVLITLKTPQGELEFSYFAFSDDLQGVIYSGFRLDLGYREFEMLCTEKGCEKELGEKLTQQYNLIMQKYGECHIKERCDKLYQLKGQEIQVL